MVLRWRCGTHRGKSLSARERVMLFTLLDGCLQDFYLELPQPWAGVGRFTPRSFSLLSRRLPESSSQV